MKGSRKIVASKAALKREKATLTANRRYGSRKGCISRRPKGSRRRNKPLVIDQPEVEAMEMEPFELPEVEAIMEKERLELPEVEAIMEVELDSASENFNGNLI